MMVPPVRSSYGYRRLAHVPRCGNLRVMSRIPLLDIGPFLAAEPGARAALAREIETTCRDTGFLVISGHGIDPGLIDATFTAASGFFDLPEARKLALKVGDLNIGYLPYGAQIVRTSKVHVNTQPNLSESFYIVNELSADDPRIVSSDPRFLGLKSARRRANGSGRRMFPTRLS